MIRNSLLALVLWLLVGCSSLQVNSERAPTYHSKLDRVLVSISMIDSPLNASWVEKIISEKLSQRGITVQTVVHKKLELEDPVKEAWNAFKPDQVLSIETQKVNTVYFQGNAFITVDVANNVYDVSSKTTVWRSTVHEQVGDFFTLTEHRDANNFVDALIEKLDEDDMLPKSR